ncbi:MAG: hypothetical protein ACREX8_22005 [Gammaproteobacteria bacterium]
MCYYSGVVWISRLGHTYQHHPPTIIEPLPDSIPLNEGGEDTEIWDDLPPEADPEPDPPPEPSTDIPPF